MVEFPNGTSLPLSFSTGFFSEKLSGSVSRGRRPWAWGWPAAWSATLGVLGKPRFVLSGQARPFLRPCAHRGCCGKARVLSGPSVQPGSECVACEQSRLQTT